MVRGTLLNRQTELGNFALAMLFGDVLFVKLAQVMMIVLCRRVKKITAFSCLCTNLVFFHHKLFFVFFFLLEFPP